MRRILSVIVFCVLSLPSMWAQGIVKDDVDGNGLRTILGELVNVRSATDKTVFCVGVCGFSNDNICTISLMLKATNASPFKIQQGMNLLIRTSDDSVINLKADNNCDATVRDVHNINGFVYSDYSTTVFYKISDSDAQKIMQGVKKIRVESTQGAWDKDFKKDKIGTVVKSEYPQIKAKLSVKKSFSDGF